MKQADLSVSQTMSNDEARLQGLSESDLNERRLEVIASASPRVRQISDWLAEIALEAKISHDHYLGRRSREVRWFYRIGAWSYSGLSAVVTAAVGGAVLALEAWPAWLRYALGSVSLLAAFIGALRPSDYLRRDLLRMDQYSALHRQIWQYLLLELPWATERAATDRAIEFGHALDTVLGIELNVTRAGTAHAQRDAASGHD